MSSYTRNNTSTTSILIAAICLLLPCTPLPTLADHLDFLPAAYLAPSPGHQSPSVRVVGAFLLVKMMKELEGGPLGRTKRVVAFFPFARTLRVVEFFPFRMTRVMGFFPPVTSMKVVLVFPLVRSFPLGRTLRSVGVVPLVMVVVMVCIVKTCLSVTIFN